MKPRVDIVILNWNGWRDTLECLSSVLRLDYIAWRVVLCDNASTDGSAEEIRRWLRGERDTPIESGCPVSGLNTRRSAPVRFVELDREAAEAGADTGDARVVMIHTGSNLGFAGGCNVGLRFSLARGEVEYTWLLNNDTAVHPHALSQLLFRADAADGRVQVGSQLRYYHEPDTVQADGGMRYQRWTGLARAVGLNRKICAPLPERHEAQLDYISGASWLVPTALLRETGLMSEAYFLYNEEIDWCTRSRDAFPLCYAPQSVVYHKEGRSIGSASDTRRTSLFADYYLFCNKLRFTRRFHPFALPSVWLCALAQAANRVRRGQFDKAVLILRILFGQATKPSRAAG